MIHRLRIDKRNTKSHLKSVKLTHIILLLDLVKGVSLNTEALKITKQDIDMQNISSNNLNRYCRISNRQYLGNKHKLRDFLRTTILKECGEFNVFADLFAGTGSVASLFEDKTLIVNDILYSNYVCHNAWFGTQRYSMSTIENYIKRYNKISVKSENYVSKNFANTFFSEYNCKKIGFIREDIEKSYENNLLSLREKHILIASLLYAMDKTANTCGHYDAYRKNGILDKELILPIPLIQEESLNNRIYNTNANSLARRIVADVVYIDPPYLITRASYNEHGGWDHNDEKDLLCFIDNLHAHKMRFALSNVLSNKGKENTILATWINNNLHKYKIFNLNHTYNNSNYQGGNRDKETKEVLIINYFAD